MDSFLPQIRRSSQNRNQINLNLETKQQKEDDLEKNNDTKIKSNSDKEDYQNAQKQKNLKIDRLQQKDSIQIKKRTSSYSQKHAMSRVQRQNNKKDVMKMLSVQRNTDAKKIQNYRNKISYSIHNNKNLPVLNENTNNEVPLIDFFESKLDESKQIPSNNTLKNSFVKHPQQLSPLSLQNNQNYKQNNFQQNQLINDQILQGKNNKVNTIYHENFNQAYKFYTGFDNQNQKCFYHLISKNSPQKYINQNQTKNGRQTESGSQDEFYSDSTNSPISKKDEDFITDVSEIENTQYLFSPSPQKMDYQQNYQVSYEKPKKKYLIEESPPTICNQNNNYINSNSNSVKKQQNNNIYIRSISQNQATFNSKRIPFIQKQIQNTRIDFSISGASSPNCNTAADKFYNNQLLKNYYLNTQNNFKDNIDSDRQQIITTQRETVPGYMKFNQNQTKNNEQSSERNHYIEKVGLKSEVMKVGKKNIKILNPYKDLIIDEKYDNSIEQTCQLTNRNITQQNFINFQNNKCHTNLQNTPKGFNNDQEKIQAFENLASIRQIETPQNQQQKIGYLHFNQNYQNNMMQMKAEEINSKLDTLNKRIKQNEFYNINTEKINYPSKEFETKYDNIHSTDLQDENTQNKISYKIKRSQPCDLIKRNNNKNHIINNQTNQKITQKQNKLINIQNKFIKQCFQSPQNKFNNPQLPNTPPLNLQSFKINSISTILSESQDSINLSDKISIVGGNCEFPFFDSTIKSIVTQMVV